MTFYITFQIRLVDNFLNFEMFDYQVYWFNFCCKIACYGCYVTIRHIFLSWNIHKHVQLTVSLVSSSVILGVCRFIFWDCYCCFCSFRKLAKIFKIPQLLQFLSCVGNSEQWLLCQICLQFLHFVFISVYFYLVNYNIAFRNRFWRCCGIICFKFILAYL